MKSALVAYFDSLRLYLCYVNGFYLVICLLRYVFLNSTGVQLEKSKKSS